MLFFFSLWLLNMAKSQSLSFIHVWLGDVVLTFCSVPLIPATHPWCFLEYWTNHLVLINSIPPKCHYISYVVHYLFPGKVMPYMGNRVPSGTHMGLHQSSDSNKAVLPESVALQGVRFLSAPFQHPPALCYSCHCLSARVRVKGTESLKPLLQEAAPCRLLTWSVVYGLWRIPTRSEMNP